MSGVGIEGYRDYLVRRDGDADLLNRRLAGREEFFGALEANPVRSSRPIDRDVFMRNLRRRRPEPGLDRDDAVLPATAKLNQAERFGVGLGETYGFNSGDDRPPERAYMELEEHYHTRLLAYVLDIFDLPFQVVAPPLVMRQFVKINVFLPERLGFLFVGAAEMAGCIMLRRTAPRRRRIVRRRTRRGRPDRAALLRNPHRRDRPRRRLRRALHHCRTAIMRRLYPRIGRLLLARPSRSASSPIARSFMPASIGPSMSTSSAPAYRTRRFSPPTHKLRIWNSS